MYRFDGHGKLLTQHKLSFDFQRSVMVVGSTGKITVVGYRPKNPTDQEARKYFDAILDADDQLQSLFDIALAENGTGWVPARFPRMASDGGIAHLILQSGVEPHFAIANISESGKVEIIPPDTVSGARAHDWFFGEGVAAELYQFPGEKPPGATQWDTYDLTSGKKISTRTLLPTGFAVACYLGDAVSVLAHSAHVEKSRGLPPDALRLVAVKLQ